MYQEIDDPEDESLQASAQKRSLWLTLCLVMVAILVTAATWFALAPSTSAPLGPTPAEQQAAQYDVAMGEPALALKRARLRDFLDVHPASPFDNTVKAELAALDKAEAQRWSELTEFLYDPKLTATQKRTHITEYEADWGPTFLGEREAELSLFRKNLPQDETANPDERTEALDFTPDKSELPTTLSDTIMAGGTDGRFREIRQAPVPPVQTAPLAVLAPQVRRSANPRYPSSAQRRGIEAVVTVSLDIDANGEVQDARVIATQAPRYGKDFEKSALRAAKRTQYFPQTVNGIAQEARGVVKRYRFEME